MTQRHASEEAGVECAGEQFFDAALAVADDEFFERWRVECQFEAVVFAELLGGVARFLQAEVGGFAEALGPRSER